MSYEKKKISIDRMTTRKNYPRSYDCWKEIEPGRMIAGKKIIRGRTAWKKKVRPICMTAEKRSGRINA